MVLATLTGVQALGDAIHEQVQELELGEVPGRKGLVLFPELLRDLTHGCPRKQGPFVLASKGGLDVAGRESSRVHLHRQLFQGARPLLEFGTDPGTEGFVGVAHLWKRSAACSRM